MGVAEKIKGLQDLDKKALHTLWMETAGEPPPNTIKRNLLLLALAYRIQEQNEGGLSKVALKYLGTRAIPSKETDHSTRPLPPTLKPGTRLVRAWRGEVHQVTALDDGFEYRGVRHSSLSKIARTITGTRWSGPAFFGLRNDQEPLREPTHEI
jgi:DUF2924 family protein